MYDLLLEHCNPLSLAFVNDPHWDGCSSRGLALDPCLTHTVFIFLQWPRTPMPNLVYYITFSKSYMFKGNQKMCQACMLGGGWGGGGGGGGVKYLDSIGMVVTKTQNGTEQRRNIPFRSVTKRRNSLR